MSRKVLILFLCIIASQIANAQTWSLQKIITRVVQQNPQVRSKSNQVAAREGALRQAEAYPNPEIGGITGNRTQMLTVGQQIEYPAKRRVRIRQAEIELEVARRQMELSKLEVIYRTLVSYYKFLSADRRVALYRQNIVVSQKFFAAAQKKFDQGFGSNLNVIKAQVEVARARQMLLNAQKEYIKQYSDLKLTLNLAPSDSLIVSDDFSIALIRGLVDFDSLLQKAQNHPRMQLKNYKLVGTHLDMEAAELATRPDFNFDLAAGVEDNEKKVELELSVPLALWDRKSGLKSQAYFINKSAQNDSAEVWLKISRRLIAAFYDYQNAQQTMQLFGHSLVDQAKAAADMAQQAFESSSFRFLDLIDAQRTYLDTALEFIEAENTLRLAEVELLRSTGTIYTGD